MAHAASASEIADQLKAISSLSRIDLIERWTKAYGRPPPKGTSRKLLQRSTAYHLQVKAFGGLKPATRRRLLTLASGGKPNGRRSQSSRTRLAPGTRLVREWNGRTHTVEVTEQGFAWKGATFGSLSAVAHAITGARWSGPRFFGL